MKRALIFLIAVICLCGLMAEDLVYKTLDNGMQVAVKRNTTNNSAAVYSFVKTGGVKEEEYLGCGISHYLEHIVSSGTTDKHTESEYTALYEKYGILSNAYTTMEMTSYHLSGDRALVDTMITTVGEFLRFCQFDQFEIDREKEVILKEMIMRSTDVNEQIRNWQNAMRYPKTNSKYPIIGYPELYKTLTRDDLVKYYNKHYQPNNIIFVVTGNVNPHATLEKIEAVFADWPRGVVEPVYLPEQNPYGTELSFCKEFKIKNPQVAISYIIPKAYYQYAAELNAALELLFSKRNSAINYLLKEELQLVNEIWAYSPLVPTQSGTNSVQISFEPRDAADIDRIIEIIDTELAAACQKGFGQKELDNYINRTKASHILYELTPDREANLIGWSFYGQGDPDLLQTQINTLESIELADMPTALDLIVLNKQRVITRAMPESEQAESDLSQVAEVDDSFTMEEIEMKSKATLYYNESDQQEVVNAALWLPITQNWEDTNTAGILQMSMDLLFKGSKHYQSLEVTEWMEDHVVSLNATVDGMGTMINIKCLSDDLEELLHIFADGFENPSFSEEEIELWKSERMSRFQARSATAGYQHQIFRSGVLYGADNRWGMTTEEIVNLQMSYNAKDLHKFWKKAGKADQILIAINGDISRQKAVELSEYLASELPQGKVDLPQNKLVIPEINAYFEQQYDYEQVNVNINLPGPASDDPDFKVMQVINMMMNRTDGGLHEATRGSRDLAYYAYCGFSTTGDYGFMRLTSQTSINKKDELINVLKEHLDTFKTIEISQEEISRVVANYYTLQRNNIGASYLPRLTLHNEINGLGYDWFEKGAAELENVTAEDIRRVASRYFDYKAVIVSYPSDDFERTIE